MRPSRSQSERPAGTGPIAVRVLGRTPGLSARQIARAARAALGKAAFGSVSVAVVNDEMMADLHERYLGGRRATDVLSFDLRDRRGQAIEGEIVVSADAARRVARRLGLTPREELLRYVIHGALHLIGLDDRTPAQRRQMRRQENVILAKISAGDDTRRAGRGRAIATGRCRPTA